MGTARKIWLVTSGGAMMALRTTMARMAYLLLFARSTVVDDARFREIERDEGHLEYETEDDEHLQGEVHILLQRRHGRMKLGPA